MTVWITAVLVRVILAHALGLLQAHWTVHADPMQMAGRAITQSLDHAAAYMATVVAALPFAILEIGTFASTHTRQSWN